MDARRFDLFARGFARSGTRRTVLRSLAIAVTSGAAGAAAPNRAAAVVALDSTAGVGGADATGACPPSRRPTRRVAGVPPFPAEIVGGTCADQDDSVAFNLIDAGALDVDRDPRGSASAVSVARSLTAIRVSLDDLLAKPHAIVVRSGGTSDEEIVCGDIGGFLADGELALGLRERNGSGYAGTAHLSVLDGQTRVGILIARDLFELVDSWEGAVVVTIIDLNLRTAPSEDAKIVTILGEGTVLTVTGAPQGEWLPVTVDATGQTGYVSSLYVQIQ